MKDRPPGVLKEFSLTIRDFFAAHTLILPGGNDSLPVDGCAQQMNSWYYAARRERRLGRRA